jgi:Vps52 / Sac2 family
LGAEEGAGSGVGGAGKGFFFKPSLKNRSTVFSVGSRDEVLTSQLEAPIIVPHAQQKVRPYSSFNQRWRIRSISTYRIRSILTYQIRIRPSFNKYFKINNSKLV